MSDFLNKEHRHIQLKKGDSVTLVGFGTFSVRKRAARTGRNPRTGESPATAVNQMIGGTPQSLADVQRAISDLKAGFDDNAGITDLHGRST